MHTMDAIERSFSAGYEQGAKDYKEQRDLLLQENAELVGKTEQLEEAVGRMAIELAAVKKERDSMLKDLKDTASCDVCKNIGVKCREYWEVGEMGLNGLCQGQNWEWRGVDE